MKRLLFLGAVLLVAFALFLGLALPARQELADSVRVAHRFIGAWQLAWLEEPDADGNIHKADCSGLPVYTRDGHISVQVMYRSPQGAAQAGPVRYAQGGYEASFGTYQINENVHTFTFHVEGAMVRGLIGKDLTRLYELSGKQLIVKSSDPNEHWRVAWERY